MIEQVLFRPGKRAPVAGQYVMTDASGNPAPDHDSEYTLSVGDEFPPTARPDMRWRLVDRSRHKGDPTPQEEA